MSIKSIHLAALVVVGSTFVFGGCGPEAAGDAVGGEEASAIATREQAVTSGWTSITSEEYPPITCDGGSMPSAARCYGSSCDDMSLYCQPTSAVPGHSSYWTPPFSEEDSATICDSGFMVTGLACSGSYCNDLSLRCTFMGGIRAKNCRWTGWMSEENGGYLSFGSGYFMKGAQCYGGYCDQVRYYVCQL